MEEALFVPDGELMVPTGHTRGPWDPRAQHGGAPAALLARAVELVEAPGPMSVTRMTVELLRPVPLTPLRVATRVLRPGRRVQLIEAVLADGETEVCRATALRVRIRPAELPELEDPEPLPHAGPEDAHGSSAPVMEGGPGFGSTGCELRFASGAFDALGSAVVWIRLRVPVVPGEAPSPLARVAAAADYGNGVSAVLDWSRRLFINPDLGIWLHRQAEGEWVCLEARTHVDPTTGVGLAESALWDGRGRIGRSTQSLLVEDR